MKPFLICILLLQAITLCAYQPYHATVTVATSHATVSDPNLVDLSRSLRGENIQALIPIYTPTSPVSIDINLRGIDVFTFFPANSTTLSVVIPQAGITESFTAATREDSLILLRDYIRNGGTKHRLLRGYAKFSPIDPIAGNPISLMAQMAQSDYELGRLSPLTGCDCCWSSQPIRHQFQTGAIAGRAFADPFDTTIVTLPLRYSYSPDRQWAFIVDAPFTYNRNGGASSAFASLGMGLRTPITHNWSITPLLRLGTGGTLDLCTSGNFFSIGATSFYSYKIKQYVLAMTNYAADFTSVNLWLTGVNFNYHLHNTILKNGISLGTCKGFMLCGRSVNFRVDFADSYFPGNRLYINHYDEVGITFITSGINPRLNFDSLSLGFTYQFGEKNFKGYFLNLVYQF